MLRINVSIVYLVCFLAADWCVGIQWTNPRLQDGATLSACAGKDVEITWTFSLPSDEHIIEMEWRFAPAGSPTEDVIATSIHGHFFTDAVTRFTLEPVGNGGIRILGVTSQDSGTYSLHVNVNKNGSVMSYVQAVNLSVSNELLTTDGRLHVRLLPNATFVDSTQQHHVLLACGHFNPFWADKIHVVWETPDHRRLTSTSQAQGEVTLAVPNPVVSGAYTCKVDTATSPASSLCINGHSSVLHGASVLVEGEQAKVMLLESQVRRLAEENTQLEQVLHQLRKNQTCDGMNTTVQPPTTAGMNHTHAVHHTTVDPLCALAHQRENSAGVRLVNGSTCLEGRVEVFHGGQWGTICDDHWGKEDATVVCRQLGLPTVGVIAWSNAYFGAGPQRPGSDDHAGIFMDEVNCGGSESSLQSCAFDGWNNNDCTHPEDAGVTCSSTATTLDLRLVNGSSSSEGRVEVSVNHGPWGTICDSDWGNYDAMVVCRQLGLPFAGASGYSNAHFSAGTGPILMNYLYCTGSEATLLDCPAGTRDHGDSGFGNYTASCNHSNDVGVVCG